jgi:hypothetical protein
MKKNVFLIVSLALTLAVGCKTKAKSHSGDDSVSKEQPAPSQSSVKTPAHTSKASKPLGYFAQQKKDAEKRCAKVVAEFEKVGKANPTKNPDVVAAQFQKSPPAGVSKEDATWCLVTRLKEEEMSKKYTELLFELSMLARVGYESTVEGAFCPSTSRVPAQIKQLGNAGYKPSASDFSDEGWKCLKGAEKFEKMDLAGQVEYRKISKTAAEAIVRRPGPTGKEEPTEYVTSFKVVDGKLIMAVETIVR